MSTCSWSSLLCLRRVEIVINEVVAIKFYLKPDFDPEQYNTQKIVVDEEQLVIQDVKRTQVAEDSRKKYNRALEVFQRFTACSTQVGTNQFNQMLSIFSRLIESSEQNKFEEFKLAYFVNEIEPESPESSLKKAMHVEPQCAIPVHLSNSIRSVVITPSKTTHQRVDQRVLNASTNRLQLVMNQLTKTNLA